MQSWESYIREAENNAEYACRRHASEFGIKGDTEEYMIKYGIDCSEMPCRVGCPFIPKRSMKRSHVVLKSKKSPIRRTKRKVSKTSRK